MDYGNQGKTIKKFSGVIHHTLDRIVRVIPELIKKSIEILCVLCNIFSAAIKRHKQAMITITTVLIVFLFLSTSWFEGTQFAKTIPTATCGVESSPYENTTKYLKDDRAYMQNDTTDVLNSTYPTTNPPDMTGGPPDGGNYDMDDASMIGRPGLTVEPGGYDKTKPKQYQEWNTSVRTTDISFEGDADLYLWTSAEMPENMTLRAQLFDCYPEPKLYLHDDGTFDADDVSDPMNETNSTGSLQDVDNDTKDGLTLNITNYHEWTCTFSDGLSITGHVDAYIWTKRWYGLGAMNLIATLYDGSTSFASSNVTQERWPCNWTLTHFEFEGVSKTISAGGTLKLRIERTDSEEDEMYIAYNCTDYDSYLIIPKYVELSSVYFLHDDANITSEDTVDPMNSTSSKGVGVVDFDGDTKPGLTLNQTVNGHEWNVTISAAEGLTIDGDVDVYLWANRSGVEGNISLNVSLYNYTNGVYYYIANTTVTNESFDTTWGQVYCTLSGIDYTIGAGCNLTLMINRTDTESDELYVAYNSTDYESKIVLPGTGIGSHTEVEWSPIWNKTKIRIPNVVFTLETGHWLMVRVYRADSQLKRIYLAYDMTDMVSYLVVARPLPSPPITYFFHDDGSYDAQDVTDWMDYNEPILDRSLWDGPPNGGDFDNDGAQWLRPGLTVEHGGYDDKKPGSYQYWEAETLTEHFDVNGPIDIFFWAKASVKSNITACMDLLDYDPDGAYTKYYLYDDGSFDVNDTTDLLNTTSPMGSTLGDYDNDGVEGLTVTPGGYDPDVNASYQDFEISLENESTTLERDDLHINTNATVNVTINLWVNASATNLNCTLRVLLLDREGNDVFPDGYKEIGGTTVSNANWATSWTETNFTISNVNYTVWGTHKFVLRVDMPKGDGNLSLAYNTTTYNSHVNITSFYYTAANMIVSNAVWSDRWEKVKFGKWLAVHTWPVGHSIVIKTYRADNTNSLLYLAYDTLVFNSTMALYQARPTKFYLRDDGAYDVNDVTDWLTAEADYLPQIERNMEKGPPDGGNFDNDAQPPPGRPGLTLESGGYNATKPLQYQQWNTTSLSGLQINGSVDISLWTMASSVGADMTLKVELFDCRVPVFYLNDDGTYTLYDAYDWTNETTPTIDRNLYEGGPLGGDFDQDDSRPGITLLGGGYNASDNMTYQEWNTTAIVSPIKINGTVKVVFWTRAYKKADMSMNITLYNYSGTDYYKIANTTYNNPEWPVEWTKTEFIMENIEYTVPAGDKLMLRATREDHVSEMLFLAYDTTSMPSHLELENKTLIGTNINSTVCPTTWEQINFTISGVSYTVQPGHQLMLRVNRSGRLEAADALISLTGVEVSGTYADTQTDNGVYHELSEETAGSNRRLIADYNFSSISVSPSDVDYIEVGINAWWTAGNLADPFSIYLRNFVTSTWDQTTITVSATTDGTTYVDKVTGTGEHLNPDGYVWVRIWDAAGDGGTDNIRIDYLYVNVVCKDMFLAYNCSDYESLLNTSTTNFYLHDDLSNDATDPTDPMNTTQSTGSLEDVDNDGVPGLTMKYGGYNISKPKQYQEWYTSSFGTSFPISGDIKIRLWQNATNSINVSIMVRVYDYQSTVFYLHDDGTYDFHDSTDWMNETAPSIERNMGKGPPDGGDFDCDGKRPGLTLIGGGYDVDEPMSFQEWNTTVLEDDFIFSGNVSISLWTKANNTANMTVNLTLFDYNPTDITFYLHDDGSYDANDVTEPMNETPPTKDKDMGIGPPNGGDYDNDGNDGLTLMKGGYNVNYPKQYQDWKTTAFAKRTHVSGNITIRIWSKAPTANNAMTLRFILYDYNPATDMVTEIGSDDYASAAWPTGWTKIDFTIAGIDYIIDTYHSILLRVDRTDTTTENLFLAYGTKSYPAFIDFEPYYTFIGYAVNNSVKWSINWTETNFTITNVDYTVPKGDMIVLRATRDDTDPELLFLGYDTLTYNSSMNITAVGIVLIGENTNTTTWQNIWTKGNFTVSGLSYTIPANHQLLLRIDCTMSVTETADADPTMNQGTIDSGSYTDTQTNNGVTQNLKERTTGQKQLDATYTFDTDIPESEIKSIELGVNAWWTYLDSEAVKVSIYNYDNSLWDEKITIVETEDGTTHTAALTIAHIRDSDGQMLVRFAEVDASAAESVDTLYIDYLYIKITGGNTSIAYNSTDYDSNLTLPDSTIYYLHDDGTNNANDPTDIMNTTSSTGTLQDLDGDGIPGLVLTAGWYDPNYPGRYQEWYSDILASGLTINGDVTVGLWVNATEPNKNMSIRVRIYDYNPYAIRYFYLHDDSSYSLYDTSDWMDETAPTTERIMYDAEPNGGDYDCDNRRPGLTLGSGGYNNSQPAQYQEFNTSTAAEDWWIMEDVEVSFWAKAEKEVFMNVTGSLFDVCPTDVLFYLHDDGTYNANDANDTLDENPPMIDRNLNVGPPYGGDYDNDTSPGLTITDSGYDPGDATSYQDFYTTIFTTSFEFGGDIKIYLWVKATAANVNMRVRLYDNGTTGNTLIGTATYTNVPTTDWTKLEFTITTQLYTIPSGNRTLLRIDRTDANADRFLYLAYDTTTYVSYIDINPYYTLIKKGYCIPEQYKETGKSENTTGDIDNTLSYDVDNDNRLELFYKIWLYANTSDNANLAVTVTAYNISSLAWDTLYSGTGGSRVVVSKTYTEPVYSKIRIQMDDTDNVDDIYYQYNFTLVGRFVGKWKNYKFYIEDINYTLPKGHQAVLRLERGDYSNMLLFLAYDCLNYSSYFSFGIYKLIADATHNEPSWTIVWGETIMSINLNYTLPAEHELVLRASRTDAVAPLMFIAYDTIKYDSYVDLEPGQTLICSGENDTLEWHTEWNTTTISIPSVSYTVQTGRQLVLRIYRKDAESETDMYIGYDAITNESFLNISGIVYYLHDDGTFDYSDTMEPMNTTQSTGTTLQDVDADDKDGLTLLTGRYDIAKPKQYQEWSITLESTLTINGYINFTFWTNAQRNVRMILAAEVYDRIHADTTTFFLHDDGTYDANDPSDWMDTTPPLYDRNMWAGPEAVPPGGDYDQDNNLTLRPGLTLESGGFSISAPTQYQDWITEIFTEAFTIKGDIEISMWSMAPYIADMTLKLELFVGNSSVIYYLWDDGSYDILDPTDNLTAQAPLYDRNMYAGESATPPGGDYDLDTSRAGLTLLPGGRALHYPRQYQDWNTTTLGSDLVLNGDALVSIWTKADVSTDMTLNATLLDYDPTLPPFAYYLRDDGTFDATDPTDYLNTTYPNRTVLVSYDNDANEGLKLYKGDTLTNPLQYQDFETLALTSALPLYSTVRLYIWLNASLNPDASYTFITRLYNKTGAAYTLLAQPQHTRTMSGVWTEYAFNINVTSTIAAGSQLVLRISLTSGSANDLFVAYDTTTYDSRLEIFPGERIIKSATLNNAWWPMSWNLTNITIPSVSYTVQSGHQLMLRTTRTDTSTPRMFLAYDTTTYDSLMNLTLSAGYQDYYLRDDGSYNVNDVTDWLSTAAPTTARDLSEGPPTGGDFDCDDRKPGLTLKSGGYDTTKPGQYQEWLKEFTSETEISGDVNISIWTRSYMPADMTLKLELFAQNPTKYTFYLHDDRTFSANDPIDYMDTLLPNLTTVEDFDNDGKDGLTLVKGSYDPAQPTQYQDWNSTVFENETHISGDIPIQIWAKAQAGTPASDVHSLRAILYDYNPTSSTYTPIGGDTYSMTNWLKTWFNPGLVIEDVDYYIPAGNKIILRLDRMDTSNYDMYLAYNTTTYNSRVEIRTQYNLICSGEHREPRWDCYWHEVMVNFSDVHAKIPKLDSLTLRASRNDSSAELMYLAYNTTSYDSYTYLSMMNNIFIANATNTSAWGSAWTQANFTLEGFEYTIPANHSLLLRVDVPTEERRTANSVVVNPGSETGGSVTDTHTDNSISHNLTEGAVGGQKGLVATYTFSTSFNKNYIQDIEIGINAWWTCKDPGDNPKVSIYNYVTASWDATTITITASSDGILYKDNTTPTTDHISAGGEMRIRFVDGGRWGWELADTLYVDWLYINILPVEMHFAYNCSSYESLINITYRELVGYDPEPPYNPIYQNNTTMLYLHDDESFSYLDTVEPMDNLTSSGSLMDVDNDGILGLTMIGGGFDAEKPKSYQYWITKPYTENFTIRAANITLWVNSSLGMSITVRVTLYDCVPSKKLYLHDDGAYSVKDVTDPLNESVPEYERNMYKRKDVNAGDPWGGDYDSDDARPGLTLIAGGYNSSAPRQYQDFISEAFNEDYLVTGNLTFKFWAMAEYEENIAINATLYDWNGVGEYPTGWIELGNVTYTNTAWSTDWLEVELYFVVEATVSKDHSIVLRLTRNDTKPVELYIAYDSKSYPSYINLGTKYKTLGIVYINDPEWPTFWTQYVGYIRSVDYEIPAGSQLVLRATRTDNSNTLMFLAYDTIRYLSNVTLEKRDYTEIATATNTSTWPTTWTMANFTMTGLNYNIITGHHLMLRIEMPETEIIKANSEPTITYGNVVSGSYTDTQTDNSIMQVIKEEKYQASRSSIDIYYEFNTSVSEGVITDITLGLNAWWTNNPLNPADDKVDLYFYNWETTTWDKTIIAIAQTQDIATYTDSITGTTDHINGTGYMRVRFRDRAYNVLNDPEDTIYIDYLYIKLTRELFVGYNASSYESFVNITNGTANFYYYLHDDETYDSDDAEDPMNNLTSTGSLLDVDDDGYPGLTMQDGGYATTKPGQYQEWWSEQFIENLTIQGVNITIWVKTKAETSIKIKVTLFDCLPINRTKFFLADDAAYDANDAADELKLANGSGGAYEPTVDRNMYEGPPDGGDYDYDNPTQDTRPGLTLTSGGYDANDNTSYQFFNTTAMDTDFKLYGRFNLTLWTMASRGLQTMGLRLNVYRWEVINQPYTGADFPNNHTLLTTLIHTETEWPALSWTKIEFVSDPVDDMIDQGQRMVIMAERTDTNTHMLFLAYDTISMPSNLQVNWPSPFQTFNFWNDETYNSTDTTDVLSLTYSNWTLDVYAGVEKYYPLFGFGNMYYGGDFDNDSAIEIRPGRTLASSDYNLTGSDHNSTAVMIYDTQPEAYPGYTAECMKYEEWKTSAYGSDFTISGSVNVTLYAFTVHTNETIRMNATLYEYTPSTANYEYLAMVQNTTENFQNGWTGIKFYFPSISATISAGNCLLLRINRNDDSKELINLGYDCTYLASYINITTPTGYQIYYLEDQGNRGDGPKDTMEGLKETEPTSTRDMYQMVGGDFDCDCPKEKTKPGLTLTDSGYDADDPSSYQFWELTPALVGGIYILGDIVATIWTMCPSSEQSMTLNLTLYDWDNTSAYDPGLVGTGESSVWQIIGWGTFTNTSWPINWTQTNITINNIQPDAQARVDTGHRLVLMATRDDTNSDAEMYLAYDTETYPARIIFKTKSIEGEPGPPTAGTHVKWVRTYNATTDNREWYFIGGENVLIRANVSCPFGPAGVTAKVTVRNYTREIVIEENMTMEAVAGDGSWMLFNYTYTLPADADLRIYIMYITGQDPAGPIGKWEEVFEVVG